MTCPMCDGDGFDARYVESCPQCGGSGKVGDHGSVARPQSERGARKGTLIVRSDEPPPCDVCGREMEAVECCDCDGSGMWDEPCHNCCGSGVTLNCRGVDRKHERD